METGISRGRFALRRTRFGTLLAALCLLAAVLRLLLLQQYLAENPFAAFPFSDGEHYWKLAGEFTQGRWPGREPFLVAPLYPLLLGVLRACGGGLAELYALQLALHLATAALLGCTARRRFGPGAGLAAAALFLALAEPALFATRVLGVTLQLALATLVWWEWTRLAELPSPGPAPVARVAGALGLLALAFPAALLLVPFHVLWLLRTAGPRRALLGAATAVLVVSPATLHNARAAGELIPISAHAGITLAQGNGPESDGVYTPLSDVGTSIHEQHRDAARSFEREHGRPGSWSEVDAHYRRRVFDWWLQQPAAAARLFARKLHWTLGSRHYDNVTAFALEREHGLLSRAALSPLEIPWLVGLAALGVATLLGERRGSAPELALLALPLFVCIVFQYSARYRVLAAPVLCALAALPVFRWRARRMPWPVAAAIALAPLPLLALDAATGFGSLDFMRQEFAETLARQHLRAGRAREAEGDVDSASFHYRRAIAADPGQAIARRRLYNLEISSGRHASALRTLEGIVREQPRDADAQLALAWLLASAPDPELRRGPAARAHALEAVRLTRRRDPDAFAALALAESRSGQRAAAIDALEHGAALARQAGDADRVRALEQLKGMVAAGRSVASRPRRLAAPNLAAAPTGGGAS